MPTTLLLVFIFLFVPLYVASSIGLGTYVGNPNGNDPKAMAAFEAQFDNFTKVMGKSPSFMNTFVDYTHDWNTWVDNANWGAWSWSLSNRSKDLIPVVGLPMMPASYYNTEDVALNQVISGQQDQVFLGIVKAFITSNFTTVHFRIGWEADGNWYAWNWNSKNSSGDPILPQWIEAYRHIAKLVHSVPGIKVYTTWNPCNQAWTPFNITLAYPGDDVVDVIALDIYSPVWPSTLWDWQYNNGTMASNVSVWSQNVVNREHYWSYPGATQWEPTTLGGWGMLSHLYFAKARGKPIALCETGVGVSPSYPYQGIADDGDFPLYLHSQIYASGVDCLYANIWDVNVGDGLWEFSDGSKPAAAASWKAAFGA